VHLRFPRSPQVDALDALPRAFVRPAARADRGVRGGPDALRAPGARRSSGAGARAPRPRAAAAGRRARAGPADVERDGRFRAAGDRDVRPAGGGEPERRLRGELPRLPAPRRGRAVAGAGRALRVLRARDLRRRRPPERPLPPGDGGERLPAHRPQPRGGRGDVAVHARDGAGDGAAHRRHGGRADGSGALHPRRGAASAPAVSRLRARLAVRGGGVQRGRRPDPARYPVRRRARFLGALGARHAGAGDEALRPASLRRHHHRQEPRALRLSRVDRARAPHGVRQRARGPADAAAGAGAARRRVRAGAGGAEPAPASRGDAGVLLGVGAEGERRGGAAGLSRERLPPSWRVRDIHAARGRGCGGRDAGGEHDAGRGARPQPRRAGRPHVPRRPRAHLCRRRPRARRPPRAAPRPRRRRGRAPGADGARLAGRPATTEAAEERRLAGRPVASEAAASDAARHTEHRVQPGETLWSIARSYFTTVDSIRAANGMQPDTVIQAGQTLRIPRRAGDR
jgi:hypothetical protein